MRNARALAAQGDPRGARILLEQALDAAGTMLGADHPDVLAATRQLAHLYTDLGELPDARRLLEEALAAGDFRLGEDHPLILSIAYDLARLAAELGNLHEAR